MQWTKGDGPQDEQVKGSGKKLCLIGQRSLLSCLGEYLRSPKLSRRKFSPAAAPKETPAERYPWVDVGDCQTARGTSP